MKFGEKYELLESITTGKVETFVANDKIRGSRVLVHILECEAQKPNQPTVQWVLESFRHVAPEPAALVLETGRYSGTLYAYLVTKMPEEAALNNWLRLYKSQSGDTQEISIPAKPSAASEAPTANLSSMEPSEPSRPAPSLTQLFRELDSPVKPASSTVPPQVAPQVAPPVPQPAPNVKSASDHSALHPAPDWNAAMRTPPPTPAKVEPTSAASGSSFSSAFTPPNLPTERNTPGKDGPKPGEFTNFFQGPFRVEGPPEIPTVSPQPIEPPRKSVGDFTAMFNPPRAEEPVGGSAGNESPGTGFTGWFNAPNLAPRPSGTSAASPSGLQRPPVDDFSSFPPPLKEPFVPAPLSSPKPPATAAMPPTFPIPPLPTPVLERPAVKLPSVPSEGATSAFQRPLSAPAAVEAKPAGPSAYTQIISVKPPAGPAGVPNATSPASFAAPMPPLPTMAPPPLPAVPPMPKLAAPQAPKAPKMAVAEAPAVSYWPLILTLTVLFFIAVLLVLYFALKH